MVIDYVDKRVPVAGHLGYCSSMEAIGNMAALRAVTSVVAHYLRADEDIGVIAPGRYADFWC